MKTYKYWKEKGYRNKETGELFVYRSSGNCSILPTFTKKGKVVGMSTIRELITKGQIELVDVCDYINLNHYPVKDRSLIPVYYIRLSKLIDSLIKDGLSERFGNLIWSRRPKTIPELRSLIKGIIGDPIDNILNQPKYFYNEI